MRARRDAIGLGHVSRCLALAEAIDECGVGSVFLGNFGPLAQRLMTDARFAWEAAEAETGSPTTCSPCRRRLSVAVRGL